MTLPDSSAAAADSSSQCSDWGPGTGLKAGDGGGVGSRIASIAVGAAAAAVLTRKRRLKFFA